MKKRNSAMTTSFIGWLNDSLAGIKKFVDEKDKPSTGEEVVGILGEDLKRFLTLLSKVSKETEKTKRSSLRGYTQKKPAPSEVMNKITEDYKKFCLLRDIFWYEINLAFPGHGNEHLKICNGFQVVKPVPQKYKHPHAVIVIGGSICDFLHPSV